MVGRPFPISWLLYFLLSLRRTKILSKLGNGRLKRNRHLSADYFAPKQKQKKRPDLQSKTVYFYGSYYVHVQYVVVVVVGVTSGKVLSSVVHKLTFPSATM